MKLSWIIVALNVLPVQAQTATNEHAPFIATDSLDAARHWAQQLPIYYRNRISTNTPAFEQYAVNLMLSQANRTREKWHLDIPHSLTINDIYFDIKATAFGIEGAIATRDSRYLWDFTRSWLTQFHDHRYWPRSFRYKDAESARLAKINSKITIAEAEHIARDALYQLGFTDRGLGLDGPAVVNQYKFEETDGTVHPLPIFNVTWHVTGWDDSGPGPCLSLDVSGINKRIVEYMNFDPHAMLTLPLPPDYFKMLNLPTNYLDTAPAHQRELWGLPPVLGSVPHNHIAP